MICDRTQADVLEDLSSKLPVIDNKFRMTQLNTSFLAQSWIERPLRMDKRRSLRDNLTTA